jgi:hypothetical protein
VHDVVVRPDSQDGDVVVDPVASHQVVGDDVAGGEEDPDPVAEDGVADVVLHGQSGDLVAGYADDDDAGVVLHPDPHPVAALGDAEDAVSLEVDGDVATSRGTVARTAEWGSG